jgi:NADH dehydrogenase
MMRIVLLVATGFVGHHLLPELSAAGHECLVLTRYRPGCRELSLVPRVSVQQADIRDAGQLQRFFAGADAVINLVGILNERGRDGRGFRAVHVELVEKVLAACRENGIRRLMHMSALNAGKGKSHYLKSKGEAEALIRAAEGIEYTFIQPSVIFGEGDDFFNRFAALLKLAPLMPLACPEARLQPVWVGDVVRAMVRALDDPEAIGASLVIVGPEEFTLRELVEFTACVLGIRRRILGLPDGLARLQAAVMDFVPGKPFSTDNYRSLQTDSTSVENSLWRYGIQPRSIGAEVPGYLTGSVHQHQLDKCRKRVDG